MKKLLILLLGLCLLLAGCGHESAAPSYAFQDLSIQIPEDYIDLSQEEVAQGLDFLFGKDPLAVNGLREEKDTFAAYGLDLDLRTYGNLLIKSNNVAGELEEKDGVLYFTYTSGELTYVVSLWETEDAYWTVQVYCPTADYSKVKNDIWDILKSVTV